MVWELRGFSTEERGDSSVRHREYTTSQKTADLFDRIPRINFTDSGHGIVFQSIPLNGPRRSVRRMDYVAEQMAILRKATRDGS